MNMNSMSYDSIVGTDSRFALAFEMVGKVFTAFGRLSSAALATAHVHDAIGLLRPSIMRLIRITMAGACVVTVASCHVVPFRDNKRRSIIDIVRAVLMDMDDQQELEIVDELKLLVRPSCQVHT